MLIPVYNAIWDNDGNVSVSTYSSYTNAYDELISLIRDLVPEESEELYDDFVKHVKNILLNVVDESFTAHEAMSTVNIIYSSIIDGFDGFIFAINQAGVELGFNIEKDSSFHDQYKKLFCCADNFFAKLQESTVYFEAVIGVVSLIIYRDGIKEVLFQRSEVLLGEKAIESAIDRKKLLFASAREKINCTPGPFKYKIRYSVKKVDENMLPYVVPINVFEEDGIYLATMKGEKK